MEENRIKEYTLENGKKFTAYIPENVSSDTPVFYYSYVVGSDYETDKLWRGMEEDMARYDGDAVVIIPHDKQLVIGGANVATHKYQTNAVDAFNLVKEDLNLETTQFINGGFSAGFGYSTRTLAHYLQENPDADRQILFAVDGVINPTANLQASELQALKDNNTLIISFTQQKNHKYQANLFKSTDLPILYVVDNSIPENTPDSQYWGIHDQVARDFFDKGLYTMLIDYALGKGELELPEGFSLRYYDPNTKKITEITLAEVAEVFGIEPASGVSTALLNTLKSLEDITIESDDKTLETHLNNIRGTIRTTSILQGDYSKASYSSTTNVPTNIPNIINAYVSATASLLSKIANETTQFAKIAASIEELDFNLNQNTEEITQDTLTETENSTVLPSSPVQQTGTTNEIVSGVGAIIGGVAGTVSGVIGTLTNNENTTNATTTTEKNSTQTNQTTSSNQPSNNTTNQSTSNKSNQQQSNNTSKPSQSVPQQPQETSPLEEFPKYEELYSDDTKIVYNYNDEYKIVIHKDGDNIIGIEHYYDFETAEQATLALENLNTEYASIKNFDKIVQNDRYVKVLFKEESYTNLTITEVMEEFSNLEEVLKGGTQ